MKSLLLAAMTLASISVFTTPSAAQDIETLSAEMGDNTSVYCGEIPGKGYKCSDGTTANDGRDFLVDEATSLLTVTTRIDMTVCDSAVHMRYRSCNQRPYPDIDTLIVSKGECHAVGRKIAFTKYEELRNSGWKARIV
jgi:hypothetical protein